MAASALIRGAPLLRLRLQHHHRFATGLLVPLGRSWCSKADSTRLEEDDVSVSNPAALSLRKAPKYSSWDDQNYRRWKDEEAEIWRDIEPITHLAKDIIHSNRYMDGEQLTDEDEKVVAERLLAYHPNSDDKIGCGFDSIMPVHVPADVNVSIQTFYLEGVNLVDRHPQFKNSRCLFVVRTDGGWIDFSYQKCLRAYIRLKYPTHAERFIKEHFKRGS